jgi:FixJ family two-component response regulator
MKWSECNKQPVVFIIDDDASMRDALTKLFRLVGLRAESFAGAADFLRTKRPDVPSCVVLDIRLPGISGLDVQAALAKARMALS